VTNWYNDVIQIDSTYYAAGNQGTVLGSPDAIIWQRPKQSLPNRFFGMASLDGRLIVVGLDGAIPAHQGAHMNRR